MEEKIKVFLADDHTMVCEALARLLSDDERISIVGRCNEALKVAEGVKQTRPDVVVLDVMMPGMNGLEICNILHKQKNTPPAVLFLSMYKDEQFVERAFANGATGYLLKDSAAGELIEAIETVKKGQRYIGFGVPKRPLENIKGHNKGPYFRLSRRERQVLQMVAEGKKNRQIAEILGVAVKTVDTHRSRLMRKLDIHDQATLIKFALRHGLVPLDR